MQMFLLLLVSAAAVMAAPEQTKPQTEENQFSFSCPEPNGKFADPEQCDLYYNCTDNAWTATLCGDGLLFDDSKRNDEVCKHKYTVVCGDRVFVQKPQKGIDPRCPHANGFYDHDDPSVCNKFYNCDKGTAFEMPCAAPLVFDSKFGTCVREKQASDEAKVCEGVDYIPKTIEGFTCPGGAAIGAGGILNQHPLYPHPTDCQFFFTCLSGKNPNKLGCPKGQVFDAEKYICRTAEEVPECGCWYECGENSNCPDSCNADCTCPSDGVISE
jgi:hypothetical protein